MKRIKARGRGAETRVTIDYLREMNAPWNKIPNSINIDTNKADIDHVVRACVRAT